MKKWFFQLLVFILAYLFEGTVRPLSPKPPAA